MNDKLHGRLVLFLMLLAHVLHSGIGLAQRRLIWPAIRAGTGAISAFLWNPLFRPTHESLLRQNEEMDRLELPRIQDDEELEALKVQRRPAAH